MKNDSWNYPTTDQTRRVQRRRLQNNTNPVNPTCRKLPFDHIHAEDSKDPTMRIAAW